MPTPPDPTPEAPADDWVPARSVTLSRWPHDQTTAAVTTNRDVRELIESEADRAMGVLNQRFCGLVDDFSPIRAWAVIVTGTDEGALVGIVGVPLPIFDASPDQHWVAASALSARGIRSMSLPIASLRRATTADLEAPAVLVEDLGW